MNSIVHFEIPVDDSDRAKAFYTSTFGWHIQSIPNMAYHMVLTTPTNEETRMPTEPGAINGGMMDRNELVGSPVITISVDDIEAAFAKVKGAGGTVLGDKIEVGGMGFAGYFKDTEGNTLGLWQSLS